MRWLPASTSCVDGVLREDRSLDFSCSMNILAVRYDITINDPKDFFFLKVAIGLKMCLNLVFVAWKTICFLFWDGRFQWFIPEKVAHPGDLEVEFWLRVGG